MDELAALARSQREYHESSVLCFTETWLHKNIPDSNIQASKLCGWTGIAGRVAREKVGDLPFLLTTNDAILHTSMLKNVCGARTLNCLPCCTQGPYCLPREFSHAIVLAVYAPPSANVGLVTNVIHLVIARPQMQHLNTFITISGDFNRVTLAATLPTFKQFVDCPARGNKTLDVLYANIREAPLPSLPLEDQTTAWLIFFLLPLIQWQPVTTRTVRRWSQETNVTLHSCFGSTNWEVLYNSYGEEIDNLTVWYNRLHQLLHDVRYREGVVK